MHQADGLDGAILLKLPPQLLLGGVKADAPYKQRLKGIPLQRNRPSLRAGILSFYTSGPGRVAIQYQSRGLQDWKLEHLFSTACKARGEPEI